MGLLSWIIFGFLAGALAKWIMPGRDKGGFVNNILIGIGGAMVGGFIGSNLGLGSVTGFNLGSLFIATGGALILLWVFRKIRS